MGGLASTTSPRVTGATSVAACVLAVATCGCKAPQPERQPPGSTAAVDSAAGAAKGSAQPAVAGPAPIPLARDALEAALAARRVPAADVLVRQRSSAVAWAVVVAARDVSKEITAIEIVRVRARDTSAARLVPPVGVSSFSANSFAVDVRDLDGDGRADAAVTAEWTRAMKRSGPCKGCYLEVNETATQLYVFSGASRESGPVFTHLVAYATRTESFPEENPESPPAQEDVSYDWSIRARPAVASLRRARWQVAPDRWKTQLDLAADPLVAAGAGKDVPLALE